MHVRTHSGSSELPTYRVWGGTSDVIQPSSSYFKLQTEDLDEVWVPKGTKGSEERNSEDMSSESSSSNDTYEDSRDSSTIDLKLTVDVDDYDSDDDNYKRDKGGKFSGEDPAKRHYGSGMSSALRSKGGSLTRNRSNSVQRLNGSTESNGIGHGINNKCMNDLIHDKRNQPFKDIPEWSNCEHNNEIVSNNVNDSSNNFKDDIHQDVDIARKGLSLTTNEDILLTHTHTHYSSIVNYRSKFAKSKSARMALTLPCIFQTLVYIFYIVLPFLDYLTPRY